MSLSDFAFVVVNDLTVPDVRYIRQLSQARQRHKVNGKALIVVHNLKHVYTPTQLVRSWRVCMLRRQENIC